MNHFKEETDDVARMFAAILTLRSVEDCSRFFADLCTVNELQSLAQRFDVAQQLRAGRTYHEIAEETGASTATISRINRCLSNGNEGYNMVIERLNRE